MIYTIGFTKKTAQHFFELLICNNIDIVLDIRLNNTSQLAGFAKYPDIKYFVEELLKAKYIHDVNFAPTEQIFKDYKNKKISWTQYVSQFEELMKNRSIDDYIKSKYFDYKNNNICLLCSEETSEKCHRSLIAKHFAKHVDSKITDM